MSSRRRNWYYQEVKRVSGDWERVMSHDGREVLGVSRWVGFESCVLEGRYIWIPSK